MITKTNTSILEKEYDDCLPRTKKLYPQSRPYASTGALCARQTVLNSKQEEKEVDFLPFLDHVFDSGNCLEATVTKNMRKHNKIVASSIRLTDSKRFGPSPVTHLNLTEGMFDIGGEIDLIFTDNKGKLYLGDIKQTEDLESKVPLNYQQQIRVYSSMTGMDDCLLMYFLRSIIKGRGYYPSKKYVYVDCNKKHLISTMGILFYAQLCKQENLIPNPTKWMYNSKGKLVQTNCGFCNHKQFCHKDNTEPTITEEDENRLKNIALDQAKRYIELRPTRKERFLSWLKQQKN